MNVKKSCRKPVYLQKTRNKVEVNKCTGNSKILLLSRSPPPKKTPLTLGRYMYHSEIDTFSVTGVGGLIE